MNGFRNHAIALALLVAPCASAQLAVFPDVDYTVDVGGANYGLQGWKPGAGTGTTWYLLMGRKHVQFTSTGRTWTAMALAGVPLAVVAWMRLRGRRGLKR